MKSLFQRRKEILAPTSTILLRFFFNGRGADIERTKEALYRTLLHCFIDESSLIMCSVLAHYLDKERRGTKVRWQVSELANIFHDSIETYDLGDLEILVDALEECSDAEVLDVVRAFEISIQRPRKTALRICWSSRFYPHISLRTLRGIDLIVDNHNKEDIQKYVESTFPGEFVQNSALVSVRESIILRAKGIFLWASLVAHKLLRAFDTGASAIKLHEMLGDIPESLDNLFLDIYTADNFTTEQRTTLPILTYILFEAARPFSDGEFKTALLLSPRSFCSSTLSARTTSIRLQEATDPFFGRIV